MSRRKKDHAFKDDGRVIADMSKLSGSRSLGSHTSGSPEGEIEEQGGHGCGSGFGGGLEPPPFSWKERFHYMGAALGAALLIAFAFIAGLGIVIWLITLYGMK